MYLIAVHTLALPGALSAAIPRHRARLDTGPRGSARILIALPLRGITRRDRPVHRDRSRVPPVRNPRSPTLSRASDNSRSRSKSARARVLAADAGPVQYRQRPYYFRSGDRP